MQVRFGALEHFIIACAVLASTLLPALALMSDLPGRNNVLPLDARRAVGVFAWNVATGFQVYAIACVFASAIELSGLWCVELPGNFFRFAERAGRLGVGGEGEQQATHRDKPDAH